MSVFTVYPMRQDMKLEAGKVYEGELNVAIPADAEESFRYRASVEGYFTEDQAADAEIRSTMNQIVDWITIENPTGEIEPNGTATVKFSIEVPVDAPAGGQYATIGISEDVPVGDEGLMIYDVGELSSIIFAEVAGETVRDGEITSNYIPGFVTTVPATVAVTAVNAGNVHETARVKIVVRNAFTKEVIFPLEGEPEEFAEVVMPASIREITRDLSVLGNLGAYEVTQDVTYLGETSYNTQLLLVCPLWFIALVTATVVVAVWTIIKLHIRREKARRLI